MSILTDWSLIGAFTIKGIISCMLVAVIGYGLANIHPYHDPDDDKE